MFGGDALSAPKIQAKSAVSPIRKSGNGPEIKQDMSIMGLVPVSLVRSEVSGAFHEERESIVTLKSKTQGRARHAVSDSGLIGGVS